MKKQNSLKVSLSRIWKDYQEINFGIIIPSVNDADENQNYSAITKTIRQAMYSYVRLEVVGQKEIDGDLDPARIPSLLVKNIKGGDESIPSKFNMITNKNRPIEAAQYSFPTLKNAA